MQLLNADRIISQAKPSQAKPSQAKPSQALSFKAWAAPKLALAFAFLAFALIACGGGGSSSPAATSGSTTTNTSSANTTPTVSITCWNGNAASSKQECSAFPAGAFGFANVKVVATGSNTFSLSGLGSTSGVISTKLLGGTLTVGDGVTVRVVHTMDKTGALTLSLESGAQLGTPAYSSSYPWTLRFGFENAADVVVTGTLSTPIDPVVLASAVQAAKAMIVAQGIQKVIPATEVPASVTLVTDKGFLDCVVSGCVLLIDTGDKMSNHPDLAKRTRDLVYAAYRQNGNYYVKAMFKDDLTGATANELTRGLTGGVDDRFQGESNGMLVRSFNPNLGKNVCGLARWDSTNTGFGFQTSNACPVWN